MRTDAYVNRLILATKDPNADITKLARMVELTLNKVSETPAGEEALKLVQTRLVKSALKQALGVKVHERPVKLAAKPSETGELEPKRRKRVFQFEI